VPQEIPTDIRALEDTIRVRLIEDRPRPGVKVTTSAQSAGLVRDIQDEAQEVGRVLYLDTRNRVIGVQTLFKGGTDITILEPLTVIRGAALLNATQVVVAHNHPSGDPTPSAQDYEAFKLMKGGLASANLKLLDFLVIGRGQFISMSTESKGLVT
jgi:DNA repair protein RadC